MNILFLGDFYYDYNYIAKDIDEISKWIKENEYFTILNLEGSLDNSGKKISKRGPHLCSERIAIDVLNKLNVIGVCLANNHIMDFGISSLNKTIELLRKNDIQYTGAGKDIHEALKPIVLKNDKEKIAIINFGWDVEETVYANDICGGCAPREEKIIINEVRKLKKDYDKVIVCMHWGFEYNRLPMPYDINLAHKIIDDGAELIIGSHPHCIQAKELYNEKYIYYSLGNFYFSGRRKNFKKRFKELIPNQSDYGAGILYCSSNNFIKEFLIEYDKDSDSSKKIDKDKKLLVDISNEDFLSKEYYKKVYTLKENINPILTTNKFSNNIKIFMLFLYYRIKFLIKSLIKRR